jgi:1,2-diacylglycerol 3-beta-galactosyltransferase
MQSSIAARRAEKIRRIVVTTNNSGGGHRATAQAIKDIIERQRRPWTVEFLDLDVATEPVDLLWLLTRIHGCEIYNFMLRHGWTVGWRWHVAAMHVVIKAMHPLLVRAFRKYWREVKPDLVLSVTPHLNRAVYESLQKEWPGTCFVTLPTDLADWPPDFWFEPVDQHAICGTSMLLKQAHDVIPDRKKIHTISGMVLNPRFYDGFEADRSAERRRLGLHPDLPTGIILFGGSASKRVYDILDEIAQARSQIQLIVLCGKNSRMEQRLKKRKYPFPLHVQGFTDQVPRYMWLSDFFIGKPGPGSISEALVMGLPAILHHDFRTMHHERENVRYVQQEGVGIAIQRLSDIPKAIDSLLESNRYNEMQQRVRCMRNRAIFEVPEILDRIIAQSDASALAPANA